ncbi:hypothetical protein Drorol1_Dr00004695 [Drosera rotundifolia]
MGKRKKKQGKQGQQEQEGNGGGQSSKLDEATRIRITKALQEFRESSAEVYTFEENFSKQERADIHERCRKMGLISKSFGGGDGRRVSVYKSNKTKKKAGTAEKKEDVPVVTFSEKSKEVLWDLFIRYPPGEEVRAGNPSEHSKSTNMKPGKRDPIFTKASMGKDEIASKVDSLSSKLNNDPKMKEIAEVRAKLPITSFRDVITSAVETHQVVLISGETGCGKTTQVPQFLLDHLWGKGEACKIICTQPRRISAISVAERISYERGENVGESVGYKIRLESKGGKHSSIVFCTNGVLLRVLVSGGSNFHGEGLKKALKREVADFTHIIVDEIHERDRHSDLMLAILRDLLSSYPHLRLVLMSATLDAERFSQYFGGCPIIRVPGFTHPVKSFYLEDVLSFLETEHENHLDALFLSSQDLRLTKHFRVALDEAIDMASAGEQFDHLLELISCEGTSKVVNYQQSETGVTPLMVFSGKGRTSELSMLLSLGADCHLKARDGSTALDWATRGGKVEAAEILTTRMKNLTSTDIQKQQLVNKYLSKTDSENIDAVLIERLLGKICRDSTDGAVLVFLPGWDDITRIREKILANPFFKDHSKFLILTLHSMIPSVEQKKVFQRPPRGCRKMILSTNIAETAITIDDVVYVIDSGRMKEKSYDPYSNVSTLHSSWISRASAKQREGRAGRCQPGVCYHLYSKMRAESLPEFQVPEIKRVPIEELCLQVKMLDPHCKIEEFLKKTLDPPVSQTIRNAVIVLQDIGALSVDEQLTELGEKLGFLPVHPLTSKMLFLSILLNCLEPALTLACASDYRDPFTLPAFPDGKKRAAEARAKLASLYGGNGDQLALIAAFDCWRIAKERGNEARFCSQYFVSSSTMNMLLGMRRQLQNELIRNGYITDDEISSCSVNAKDSGILHAVLLSGLYPMVGRLNPPQKSGKRFVTVETANGDKVRLQTHSTNYKIALKNADHRPLVIFDEITRGDSGEQIRNCAIIGPLPLLLLATEIAVAAGKDELANDGGGDGESDEFVDSDEEQMGNEKPSEQGLGIMSSPSNTVGLIVDRWLSFESTALEVAQIYCLRERLSAAIMFTASHPRLELPPDLATSVQAIACLLSNDGLSGITVSVKSDNPAAWMVNATTSMGRSARGEQKKDLTKYGSHKNPQVSNINMPQVHSSHVVNHPPIQAVQAPLIPKNPIVTRSQVLQAPLVPVSTIPPPLPVNGIHPVNTHMPAMPVVGGSTSAMHSGSRRPGPKWLARPAQKSLAGTPHVVNYGPLGPRFASVKRPRGSKVGGK